MVALHVREELGPTVELLGGCTGLFSITDCSWKLLAKTGKKVFSGPSGLTQQEGGGLECSYWTGRVIQWQSTPSLAGGPPGVF